ncbi:hypothetical protein ACFZDI_32270 [Streptomyces sp. NPDC007907]|uniref:hypothetical protein n=1 Tax=Streptomyces sp. NPDC007907 TaxID=3364789 RepID=UPI0036EBE858
MTAQGYGLAVDVRGLRKRFGCVTAVDGIDLGNRHRSRHQAGRGGRPARSQRRGRSTTEAAFTRALRYGLLEQ